MTTIVQCPTCGHAVRWQPENRFRPFCSARCRQIDLGAWAAGKYRIGGETDEKPLDDDASPVDARGMRKRDTRQ